MVVAASVSAEFPPPPQHFAGIQTHSARALFGYEAAPKAAALSPVIRAVGAISRPLDDSPLALSRHPDRSKETWALPILHLSNFEFYSDKRSYGIRNDSVMEAGVTKGDG